MLFENYIRHPGRSAVRREAASPESKGSQNKRKRRLDSGLAPWRAPE